MQARKTHGQATVAAHKGAKIINDLDLHDIDASMITLSPEAIVSILQVNGEDVNVVGTYISTPGSAVGEYWTLQLQKEKR